MSPHKSLSAIVSDIDLAAQRLEELRLETQRLTEQLRIARGTQDLPPVYKHQVLYDTMIKLLSDRPMKFRELVEATKSEENPIKTCIVRMQRENIGLVNLGDTARAIWWIPDQAVLAKLVKP